MWLARIRFELRQRRPETEVRAEAERQVIVWRPPHVEAVGGGKNAFVAIPGDVPHHDLVAFADPLAAQLDVPFGGAPEVHHGRDPAQHLFDRRRQQGGVA
jgi:hypothetical protein